MFPDNPEQASGASGRWPYDSPLTDPRLQEAQRRQREEAAAKIRLSEAHKNALQDTFDGLPAIVSQSYDLLRQADVPPTFAAPAKVAPAQGLLETLGIRPRRLVRGSPLWELVSYTSRKKREDSSAHSVAPGTSEMWFSSKTSLCANNQGRLVVARFVRQVEVHAATGRPVEPLRPAELYLDPYPAMPADFPFADPQELERIISARVQQEIDKRNQA